MDDMIDALTTLAMRVEALSEQIDELLTVLACRS